LPPPAIDTTPDRGDRGTPIEEPSPERSLAPSSPTPTPLAKGLRASSGAEREALRRSMLHEDWYGWQTLTIDGAAIGIFLLGASIVTTHPPSIVATSAPLPLAPAVAAVGIYALGPSAIHFAHRQAWKGVGSIALRAIMPLAGFAVGYWGSGLMPSMASGATTSGAVGGVVGGAGAMAADAALLGWDRWYGPAAPSRSAFFSVDEAF
jgi:hypothetical protein